MNKNTRSKKWCFTLNNYTEEELDKISGIDCRYLLYGMEIGEKGTPHLQGYIVFEWQKTLHRMKKYIPRAHFEPARGTHKENYAYCTKEDRNPFEKGDLPEDKNERISAKRELKRDPINGQKVLASKRIIHGINMERAMFTEIMANKLEKPEIIYIYGASGTGKTYFAIQDAITHYGTNDTSLLRFDKSGFAHCNNPQASCLVWMEFRPSCIDAATFLELTDGYGCHLNVKHGGFYIRPKAIYICSILAPSQIYKEEINEQFQRRITKYVNKDDNPYHRHIDDSNDTQLLSD